MIVVLTQAVQTTEHSKLHRQCRPRCHQNKGLHCFLFITTVKQHSGAEIGVCLEILSCNLWASTQENLSLVLTNNKGLGSRRGEIGPAIEMHTNLKYVYMVYFIEKNRNCICLVLKLSKLWVSKDKDPL